MKTTLVILAAGIGSRYGGIKQLEPVGPAGQIIMDYSIHDAIAAGFRKIVFLIRRDIEADFRAVIGGRMESLCARLGVEIAYAFQALEDIPIPLPQGRTKPWGTGQALLACRDVLHEPFAVINADDYYGKAAFTSLFQFLQGYTPGQPGRFCMAGFILRNTLSEFGGVTRGICQVDGQGYLTRVLETKNVVKTPAGAGVRQPDGSVTPVADDSFVSMNMWGLTPEFLDCLADGFAEFFQEPEAAQREFLIPVFIDRLLQQKACTVQVLPTPDKWFGITYREDMPAVRAAFHALTEAGVYHPQLFPDLD